MHLDFKIDFKDMLMIASIIFVAIHYIKTEPLKRISNSNNSIINNFENKAWTIMELIFFSLIGSAVGCFYAQLNNIPIEGTDYKYIILIILFVILEVIEICLVWKIDEKHRLLANSILYSNNNYEKCLDEYKFDKSIISKIMNKLEKYYYHFKNSFLTIKSFILVTIIFKNKELFTTNSIWMILITILLIWSFLGIFIIIGTINSYLVLFNLKKVKIYLNGKIDNLEVSYSLDCYNKTIKERLSKEDCKTITGYLIYNNNKNVIIKPEGVCAMNIARDKIDIILNCESRHIKDDKDLKEKFQLKKLLKIMYLIISLMVIWQLYCKIYNLNRDIENVLSMSTGLFSIFLGAIALFQAKQYNDSANKTNEDTKKLFYEIYDNNNKTYVLTRENTNKIIKTINKNEIKINIGKDCVRFEKSSKYKNTNDKKICEMLEELRPILKDKYIDELEKWLELNKKEYNPTLRFQLNSEKLKLLIKVRKKLNKYGIELYYTID